MLVKICGITRGEDALAAVEAGAAALGFVFWPQSPRFVDPYRARAIVARLPPFVTTVGVFVNQEASEVNAVAALARLSAVQLHGDEEPGFANALTRPVIKAVSLDDQARRWAEWPARVTLLADGVDPKRRGGTGTLADWAVASQVARIRRLVLAGGLTPENVGEAIRRVKPFAIDVSSGVERAPGIKDPSRIGQLFDAVRTTEGATS
jgi:phosphoribosylanthranilate isomerase